LSGTRGKILGKNLVRIFDSAFNFFPPSL
jgi:hypothetical protein